MKKRTLLLTTLAVFTITFTGCVLQPQTVQQKYQTIHPAIKMEASPTGNHNASRTDSESKHSR